MWPRVVRIVSRARVYRFELFRRPYLHGVPLNLIFAIASRGRDYAMYIYE